MSQPHQSLYLGTHPPDDDDFLSEWAQYHSDNRNVVFETTFEEPDVPEEHMELVASDASGPPHHSADDGVARPQPEQWESHRATIEALYVDQRKKLEQVIKIMGEVHNFHATNFFKRQKIQKNIATRDMRIIIRHRLWRKRVLNRKSVFEIRGRSVPDYKIKRFMRSERTTAEPLSSKPLPYHIRCRTPDRPEANSTSGGEKYLYGSSSTTNCTFGPSSVPTGGSTVDVYMGGTALTNTANQSLPGSALNDGRREALKLTSADLESLAHLQSPGPEDAQRYWSESHQMQLITSWSDSERERRVVSQCLFCDFLPWKIPIPINEETVGIVLGGMDADLDMTNVHVVELVRLAIEHDLHHVVRHIVRRCQRVRFAQRLHPHLLCTALHKNQVETFCLLLLHGLGVQLDIDGGGSNADANLLAQARWTLHTFIKRHVQHGGDRDSTARGMALMYRAGVLTPELWRGTVLSWRGTTVLWTALRYRRAAVLRALLDPATGAELDVDGLMAEAAEIRQITRMPVPAEEEQGGEGGEGANAETIGAVLVAAAEKSGGAASPSGATALHLAASLLLVGEVQRLLRCAAEVDRATTTGGETALHVLAKPTSSLSSSSSSSDEEDMVRVALVLIEGGASVHAADVVGDTALHKVVRHHRGWDRGGGGRVLAQLLLARRADMINAANHRGETPLIAAAAAATATAASDRRVTDWLGQRAGCCRTAVDRDGNTADAYLELLPRPQPPPPPPPPAAPSIQLAAWQTGARLEQPWNTVAYPADSFQEMGPRVELIQSQVQDFMDI
ncbi:ankyrin repeat protein [Cordyceps javanica]|uniref:Ankyrin repeat protein n=1 Tax=Cordyceps javanica TaxID=43265 RepID=A0A545VQY2_9HYPO|nr:ankyrin repeat protein [Cordyceps javanica]TQW04075.1 ankyrin repeat protein [Cordyceps javanica]